MRFYNVYLLRDTQSQFNTFGVKDERFNKKFRNSFELPNFLYTTVRIPSSFVGFISELRCFTSVWVASTSSDYCIAVLNL